MSFSQSNGGGSIDITINDVSDIIAISFTPQTATIATNAVINYKDY